MSSEPGPGETAIGADTLLGVLRSAADNGYGEQFRALPDGAVRCGACPDPVPAARLDAKRVQRLEGASDAADMMIVVWVECTECATKGTLTLGYGPNADEIDVEVLGAIDLDDATSDPLY